MNLRCKVCGHPDPTEESATLCTGCWWRQYRIACLSPSARRRRKDAVAIAYASWCAFEAPWPELRALIKRIETARRRHIARARGFARPQRRRPKQD